MASIEDPKLAPLFLRKELLAAGHNEKTLTQALRSGAYRRPRTGAYVDGPLWDRCDPAEKYALRVRAAYRQAKTPVVISHSSPLPFLGAPTWGIDLGEVHLTRVDAKAGRREAGVRQHSGRIAEHDVVELFGMQTMTAMRVAIEVCTIASVEASLAVLNHFLNTGVFTLEQIRARYAAGMEHWPHSLRTDLVLRLADPRLESVGETRTSYLLWRHQLPTAIPQYEVREAGRVVARLDFALPEYGAWIEFDGKIKYEKLMREGERASDVVLREKRREDLIRRLTGWRCLRIIWADLEDPERLARRIRQFLNECRAMS